MKSNKMAKVLLIYCLLLVSVAGWSGEPLKVGMIGLDTSHVTAFARLMNDESHPEHVAGTRVVAGFRGGSADIPSSAGRVDEYTRELVDKYGVTIYESVSELCGNVDVVMIESVDGRPHLGFAKTVISAGKTVFIDKPVAGSLKDAVEIYNLAAEKGVPVFTSSAYRYYDGLTSLLEKDAGEIRSVISYGPAYLEPHHPDLYWYGIHPVEALFTVLGTGCDVVTRTSTDNTDVVTGIWSDGRVGNLHAIRNGKTPHGVMVFGTNDVLIQSRGGNYAPLIREVVKFLQTGISPVSPQETLEIYAFMEAADESKRQGGKPVSMQGLLKAAGWDHE